MIQESIGNLGSVVSPECHDEQHDACEWSFWFCLCSCHNIELPKPVPKVEEESSSEENFKCM